MVNADDYDAVSGVAGIDEEDITPNKTSPKKIVLRDTAGE